MTKAKMKRCPFCGQYGEVIRDEINEFPFVPRCKNVECIAHNIYFFGYRTKAEAIAAWNRRAPRN